MPEIYLDSNASAPIDPRVAAVMRPLLDGPFANPSAPHLGGRASRVTGNVHLPDGTQLGGITQARWQSASPTSRPLVCAR